MFGPHVEVREIIGIIDKECQRSVLYIKRISFSKDFDVEQAKILQLFIFTIDF